MEEILGIVLVAAVTAAANKVVEKVEEAFDN